MGWPELPDLSMIHEKRQLKELYPQYYTGERKMQIAIRVGQVWSFVKLVKIGDFIIFPQKEEAMVKIGEVIGDYEYKHNNPIFNHYRKVKWISQFPRSSFDQDLLYSFGTLMTFGRVRKENAHNRIKSMLGTLSGTVTNVKGIFAEPGLEEEEEIVDIEIISRDRIIKFIENNFKKHDLSFLIDAILKARGYTTRISPPGPDGGVDIVAGYGPLGFDKPKMVIQVKSSPDPVNVKILRELEGVLHDFKADHCILVAWGGLNKIGTQMLSRKFFDLRLWDQGKVVDEVLKNYDKFDDELKAELPLKRIWTIVEDDN